MERNRTIGQGQLCPVICIMKAALFVVICVVLLYLPLGDPKKECPSRGYDQKNAAFYCLCNFYKLFKETAKEMTDIVDVLICTALEALYNIKLKFYTLLRAIDKEDLCCTVCCPDDEVNSLDKEERSSSGCRCLKNCNRNSQK